MKSYKIEYYPDREGDVDGRKCFTIGFTVNNWKRFASLNDEQKVELLNNIQRFQDCLNIFKTRLNSEQNPERSVATKMPNEQNDKNQKIVYG